MSDVPNILMGIPKDAPGFIPPPSRVVARCEECGGEMWIGPRIRELKALHPKSPLLCFVCVTALNGGPPPMERVKHLGG